MTNDNVGPTSSPQLGAPLHALTPSPAPPPAPSHQSAAALLDPSAAPLGHSPPAATPAATTLIVAKPPTSPDPAHPRCPFLFLLFECTLFLAHLPRVKKIPGHMKNPRCEKPMHKVAILHMDKMKGETPGKKKTVQQFRAKKENSPHQFSGGPEFKKNLF